MSSRTVSASAKVLRGSRRAARFSWPKYAIASIALMVRCLIVLDKKPQQVRKGLVGTATASLGASTFFGLIGASRARTRSGKLVSLVVGFCSLVFGFLVLGAYTYDDEVAAYKKEQKKAARANQPEVQPTPSV